ncbi:MAG: hypothetical protein HUK02_09195, partial [Bacteroidaceae bacterium]|nr:hypothetical protein [Bacteroidaceae bacterium]
NGLIRIAFTGKCGDALTTDADGRFDATFTKGYIRPMGAATDTYQDALLNKEWVKNNLRAVAFVHKYNTDALGIEDNFVLNAAQRRLVAEEDIVSSVTPNDRPAQAYDLQGRPATGQSRGIVILSNGQKVVR